MSSFGYVCNAIDGTVTKFDLSAMTVSATLSISGANKIVIDAAETFAYVTNGSDVTQIDLSTFTVANTVSVGGDGAEALALDPTDTFLYVANGSGNFGDAHKIDLSTFTVVASLTVSGGGGSNSTMGVAVDPYGDFVYVVSRTFVGSNVAVIDQIDPVSFTIISTLNTTMSASLSVWGIVIDSAGAFAYAFADALVKVDLGSFTVVSIDTSISGVEDGIAISGTTPEFLSLTQGNSESVVIASLFIWFPSFSAVNTYPSDSRQSAINDVGGATGGIYTSDWGTYSGISTVTKIDIGLGTVVGSLTVGTVSGNRGIAARGHAPPITGVQQIMVM